MISHFKVPFGILLMLFLTALAISAAATTITFDVNPTQVGILLTHGTQPRLFTFLPSSPVSKFITHPEIVHTYLNGDTKCELFDLHTETVLDNSLSLFQALVHHNPELRCGSTTMSMTYAVDHKAAYTETTIDTMRNNYLSSQKSGTLRDYPSLKTDMISLSLDTLIGWAVAFIQHHWGPVHPFPTYPTDQETLKMGKANVGLYHFNGQQLSLAQSQALATKSSRPCPSHPVKYFSTVFAVTADWGSGTEESQLVSTLMSKLNPEFTINMGDLYLVGSPEDARRNALGVRYQNDTFAKAVKWLPGTVGTFWIQGNHEMYGRGYGYFDHILPNMGILDEKTKKPSGQPTSYQVMENDFWRIFMLDTGYTTYSTLLHSDDNRFNDEIMDWLKNVAKIGNPNDKRGVVIMTHHNSMSAFTSRTSPGPASQLKELLGDRVVLTMWGHEHKTAIYGQSHLGGLNAFPRCMGTGGFPVDQHNSIPDTALASKLIAFDNRQGDTLPGDFGNLPCGYNGFLTMNFTGPQMRINYFTTQWKDEAAKVLDWDLGHITMTETFSVDTNGDLVQDSFYVLDKDITVVDNVDGKVDSASIFRHGDHTYRRHITMGDLEDAGLDMASYYEANKDHQYTRPVGLKPRFDEESTKEVLEKYIQQSLATSTADEILSIDADNIAMVLKQGIEAAKQGNLVTARHHSEIKQVHIDYNEIVNVDGHKFPKIKF